MEKNNNTAPIDFDALHLKDQLNTSFDKDNITVSEDLISRTLLAINQNQTLEDRNQDKKKTFKFPTRGVISTTAAAFVLFVGINALTHSSLLGGGLFGSNKSSDSSMITETTSVESDVALGTYDSNESAKVSESAAADETAVADGNSRIMEDALDSVTTTEGTTGETPAGTTAEESTAASESYSLTTANVILFSDIVPFAADQVRSFTVIKTNQDNLLESNQEEKVNEFFNLLNGYTLSYGENDINQNCSYKLVFETEENTTYTIWIGEGIQVATEANSENNFGFYNLENSDELISGMEEFYNSLQ